MQQKVKMHSMIMTIINHVLGNYFKTLSKPCFLFGE